jgi:hypothetical protein
VTPEEYGRYLAAQMPPLTDEQVERAAIILAAAAVATPEPSLDDLPHTVYGHVGADGQLLYIGCTIDLHNRTRSHKYSSPWFVDGVTVEILAEDLPREEAFRLEQQLISERQPLHNRVGTPAWRREARQRAAIRRPMQRPSP